MSKEVSVYKADYYIEFFGSEEALKLDEKQYQGLEKALLDTDMKFVKVGDDIIACSSIKRVAKVPRRPDINKYAETGSNPLYRKWCSLRETKPFKEWLLH